MPLKKRTLYVIFMLTLLPVAVYAQTSLYGPSSGKLGGGFEIWIPNDESGYTYAIGSLGIGFNNGNSSISVLGGWSAYEYTWTYQNEGIPFLGIPASEETITTSGLIYIGGIEGIHLYPIEEMGFEVYSGAEFIVLYEEGEVDIPTTFIGRLGLSKHLEIGNGGLKPFLGLAYRRLNVVSGDKIFDLYSGFEGEAGLEYNISWFSIFGAARFLLPDSSKTVKLGVNFFL